MELTVDSQECVERASKFLVGFSGFSPMQPHSLPALDDILGVYLLRRLRTHRGNTCSFHFCLEMCLL